jgi:NADH-quinone oxidoreductase subunit G
VDICPVGALTSKDFRFKMRVWFLKETKSIDVNCGNGTNIGIGSREGIVHRITPRENDAVNSCWMPDSHRLNYHFINDDHRLQTPLVKGVTAQWSAAVAAAAAQLGGIEPGRLAMIASARLTNEELFLAKRLATALGIAQVDVLPRPQEGDGFLISNDGNPNTTGAKLFGLATGQLSEIATGVASGAVQGLIVLGEDATKCGIAEGDLAALSALVVLDILPNKTTPHATALLPASSFAEKRGSMINLAGRIQRLNRAIPAPGQARDDWEILRDLLVAVGGQNGVYSIEEVFKAMAAETAPLNGLSLAGIGDLGVELALGEGIARR